MWRCCLNPKVLAGLAAVGAALWFVNPAAIGAMLPTLVLLVCPVSMGVMMWRMRSGAPAPAQGDRGATDADTDLRALRAEVAGLRAGVAPGRTDDGVAAAPESRASVTPAH